MAFHWSENNGDYILNKTIQINALYIRFYIFSSKMHLLFEHPNNNNLYCVFPRIGEQYIYRVSLLIHKNLPLS